MVTESMGQTRADEEECLHSGARRFLSVFPLFCKNRKGEIQVDVKVICLARHSLLLLKRIVPW